MTSLAGDSCFSEDHLPLIVIAGRCHTALGIYNDNPPLLPNNDKKGTDVTMTASSSSLPSPNKSKSDKSRTHCSSPEICRAVVALNKPTCKKHLPNDNQNGKTPHSVSTMVAKTYDQKRDFNRSRRVDASLTAASEAKRRTSDRKINLVPGFLRKLRASKRDKK